MEVKMKKTIGTITAVIGIGLILLSGCTKPGDHAKGAMFRANLQRTGVYNTKGIYQLTELKWKFKTKGRVFSSPAIADGVVYFGSVDGNLYAVDIKTGQEKWKFKTEDWVNSSPAIADGVVYFGSYDGNLYAVK